MQIAGFNAARKQVCADTPVLAGVGAPESIDGLLRVTDDKQHACLLARRAPGVPAERKQNFGLKRIGVLKLVNENAVIACLKIAPRLRVAQKVAGADEKILKVEAAGAALGLLVMFDHLPELFPQPRGEVGIGVDAKRLDSVVQVTPAGDDLAR